MLPIVMVVIMCKFLLGHWLQHAQRSMLHLYACSLFIARMGVPGYSTYYAHFKVGEENVTSTASMKSKIYIQTNNCEMWIALMILINRQYGG